MIRFVTTNPGKFREVASRLARDGIEIRCLDMEYPEVQADRLEDVVRFASRRVQGTVGGDFLIDDSGLFVEALGGWPGVYSSDAYRRLGCAGLLSLMRGERNRQARFRTVFLLHLDGEDRVFRGETRGAITPKPRGTHGFGFDPVFRPTGRRKTFAEMTTEEKNEVSHRGHATSSLARFLRGRRRS